MITNLTPKDLIEFEEAIAQEFSEGKIPFPVHLRGSEDNSYENNVLGIIKNHYNPGDYFYSYWASHCWALACGINQEKIREKIRRGFSISMCFPEHNFYCSGIVASLCGVAIGTAIALKKDGSTKKVIHVCGDMASTTGIFRSAVEYAYCFDLPIQFWVENNGVSVTTNTQQTWGRVNNAKLWFEGTDYEKWGVVRTFRYTNKFSHSGVSRKVAF